MNWLFALLAGLLLFAADHPLHVWGLAFVALIPFWHALAVARARRHRLWPIGLITAAANILPLVLCTGPAPPIVAAGLASLAQWPIVAMLAGRVLDRGRVLGPLAAAAIVTLAEIVIWYAVPIFGTAQCFARPLSAAPAMVAFLAFTGVGGLVFALAATQALLAAALRGPRRGASLATTAAILALVAALDAVRWQRPLGAPLRVATSGWTWFPADPRTAPELYERAFATAGEAHARLLVTPEAAVPIGIENYGFGMREQAIATLAATARRHTVCGAVGVFSNPTNDNRIWFVGPCDGLCGEYRKTHLIPWLEDYVAGDGALATLDVDGVAVGGMICQDDNFTALARAYGRAGVRVMAVPTNDWPAIREYHLENGIFRAIENGYAIVRGASNGISAVVSPRGEVQMRLDHCDNPDGVQMTVTAEVATGDGEPTIYARCGDGPIVALCTALLAAALCFGRRTVAQPAPTVP